ncbi:MAG: D-alanyl-D-alanine carboxypeptidase/D-alanyl-D-alanine-endopeptidase [Bacteroidetes bacterium]|nr:D-alanyl-D-alanine carboxypeptidase/D-alanyl-D-alanine-endopeptidase [Bacteroidota bacterium]
MNLRYGIIVLGLLIAWRGVSQTAIDKVLQSYQADADLLHASYSFCILDAQTGKTIQEYNPELSLAPASTLKIVTTSAALGILGKNYTYKTKVYFTNRPDANGLVKGDLVVKGSGDPSLNSEYFYKDNVLQLWTEKLKAAGLKSLSGMVVTDNSCFDNRIPSTWIWGDMGNYFGTGASGLSFCDNKFIATFRSGAAGSKTELLSLKTRQGITIHHDALIDSVLAGGSEDNAVIFGAPGQSPKAVTGTIPPNQAAYEVEGAMASPANELRDELEQLLSDQGINIAYKPEPVSWTNDGKSYLFNYPAYTLAFTHVSPSLERIVYYTNTKSDNHYAETLLNTVGAAKSGKQGTTANGIDAVTAYWKGRGVDVSGLFMVDGSGLSRANAITTKIQATILSKIYRDSTMYTAFNASLPVAGKNGSMASLCKGTFAENNLRAKTGYITRARGYCGYVKTKSGKELAFSILFNNYACSPKEMKLKIERFLVALCDL